MAYTPVVTLILLSLSSLVEPLCFGWFDEDNDDEPATMVDGTLNNTSSTSYKPMFDCQALDDVFSYFNDFYEYLDQTFNPFYEPPPAPPPTAAVNTTALNETTATTAAPAKKDAPS